MSTGDHLMVRLRAAQKSIRDPEVWAPTMCPKGVAFGADPTTASPYQQKAAEAREHLAPTGITAGLPQLSGFVGSHTPPATSS